MLRLQDDDALSVCLKPLYRYHLGQDFHAFVNQSEMVMRIANITKPLQKIRFIFANMDTHTLHIAIQCPVRFDQRSTARYGEWINEVNYQLRLINAPPKPRPALEDAADQRHRMETEYDADSEASSSLDEDYGNGCSTTMTRRPTSSSLTPVPATEDALSTININHPYLMPTLSLPSCSQPMEAYRNIEDTRCPYLMQEEALNLYKT